MSRLEDSIWTREQMMEWIGKHMRFVRTTEEFTGSEGVYGSLRGRGYLQGPTHL